MSTDMLQLAALVGIACVLALLLIWRKFQASKSGPISSAEEVAAVRRGGAAGRAARLRRRQGPSTSQNEPEEDAVSEEDEDADQVTAGRSRTARLAARKAAKKAAKEEQRAAQEAREEERAAPVSSYEENRRRREREREELEAAQEEEIRRAQEEKQQQEAAEFEAWRGAITVEDQGEAAASQAQEQETLEALAQYVIGRKVVAFEELSAEFKMRTKDVVERIKVLEDSSRLTGIMDDRGKYIYLSSEELASVAEHIRSKGRISIPDLSKTASVLLDLEGKDVGSSRKNPLEIGLDELVEE